MAIVITDDKHYKAIADTIRNFSYATAQHKPEQMADAVSDACIGMYNSGLSDGWQGGYEAGKAEGGGSYDEGYEAGQQAEYDLFWGIYQDYGNKTSYDQAFANNHWTDAILRPKYPIKMEGTNGGRQTFSGCTTLTEINVPIFAKNARLVYTFQNCIKLQTISLLHMEGVTDYGNCFTFCVALENITIGGSIEKNISFEYSNLLTDASVQSIIDHLADLTGATAQTITFHATVGGKLTDAQKATITAKNWQLVY